MGSIRVSIAVLTAGVLMAGCSSAESAAPSGPDTTRLPEPDPVVVCTNQLDYWVPQQLAGAKTEFDYQEMALTGDQYDVLRDLAKEIRPLIADGTLAKGRPTTDWIHQHAMARCQVLARTPSTPKTRGGWP
jgi:hypothetical protein